MSRPTRRDSIGRGVGEVFSIAVKGIWGNDKLRTKTNIWRMIARPDACLDQNRRCARSCISADHSNIVVRRFGAIDRMLCEAEVRA